MENNDKEKELLEIERKKQEELKEVQQETANLLNEIEKETAEEIISLENNKNSNINKVKEEVINKLTRIERSVNKAKEENSIKKEKLKARLRRIEEEEAKAKGEKGIKKWWGAFKRKQVKAVIEANLDSLEYNERLDKKVAESNKKMWKGYEESMEVSEEKYTELAKRGVEGLYMACNKGIKFARAIQELAVKEQARLATKRVKREAEEKKYRK